MGSASRGRGDRRRHGRRHAFPARGLDLEVLPSRLRQAVVLRATTVLGLAPLGAEPTLLLQAMQGRKQRAGLNVERAPSDLGDAAPDPEPMVGAQGQRAQDKQIEGSLQEDCFRPRYDAPIDGLLTMRRLLSNVNRKIQAWGHRPRTVRPLPSGPPCGNGPAHRRIWKLTGRSPRRWSRSESAVSADRCSSCAASRGFPLRRTANGGCESP